MLRGVNWELAALEAKVLQMGEIKPLVLHWDLSERMWNG
jgi:hypothetical protein